MSFHKYRQITSIEIWLRIIVNSRVGFENSLTRNVASFSATGSFLNYLRQGTTRGNHLPNKSIPIFHELHSEQLVCHANNSVSTN